MRIAIIGLAGCGKSTSAGLIEELAKELGLTCVTVKIAKPLYDLQDRVYQAARVKVPAGTQDQILLESLADSMRRIRPESLADDFLTRLASTDADIVVNDDLRDPFIDAVALRAHGFRVLRVTAAPEVRERRLAGRGDTSRADRSTSDLDLIEPDVVLDNSGHLTEHRAAVRRVVRSWM
ncbi:AAA family ATPase [Actinoplanes sp. NPDC026623]|uniref:AAA family ATPase n=1 Tax=Actinoplanes sp. NPDC026623 TaxID=3155610 RepID=UPI0033F2FC7C